MEVIRGKESRAVDAPALVGRLRGYRHVVLDLGTGDGRYALHAARQDPATFAIGLDACRENLRAASRTAPSNALFVMANAVDMPTELHGLADRITINFQWGRLLAGLLAGDPRLLGGLRHLAHAESGAHLEIRLNEGALLEAGCTLAEGAARVRRVLAEAGFGVGRPTALDAASLRAFPSSWARRLAHGPHPRGLDLRATIPTAAPSRSPLATGHDEAAGWEGAAHLRSGRSRPPERMARRARGPPTEVVAGGLTAPRSPPTRIGFQQSPSLRRQASRPAGP